MKTAENLHVKKTKLTDWSIYFSEENMTEMNRRYYTLIWQRNKFNQIYASILRVRTPSHVQTKDRVLCGIL